MARLVGPEVKIARSKEQIKYLKRKGFLPCPGQTCRAVATVHPIDDLQEEKEELPLAYARAAWMARTLKKAAEVPKSHKRKKPSAIPPTAGNSQK